VAAPLVVNIPYRPRKWAREAHRQYKRWLALVLHRRAGKTTFELNHHQKAATNDTWERARLRYLLPAAPDSQIETLLRKRIYWHVMPSYKQAKLVAWEMLKDIARPIPGVKFNESELLVVYPNKNRIQLIGADNPDSLRGPGLSGLSLDEFSQHPGNVFGEILSKALADHLGYCIWSGTIKGHDQLYQLYQAAKDDPEWFALWQDVDASLATEEGATITALIRAMEDDRKLVLNGIMSQAEFDQEWYLSPEAAIKGAIYGKLMAAAKVEGRITRVPIEPALPVDTDWDLGVGDHTAIWFTQSLRSGEVRCVDYYEGSGEGLPFYASILAEKKQKRGWVYGSHWAPHDIVVRELGTGKSRLDTAKSLGINFKVTPRLTTAGAGEVEEGINAARILLPKCWFDEEHCKAGIEALRHYRRDFNARLNEFKATPVHDWSSHAADAFRGLAVRHKLPVEKPAPAPVYRPQSAWG
jgi:phage terminase large subunit